MRGLWSSCSLLFTTRFIALVAGACVPDYPEKLLADPAVLQHPAVVAAFEAVERDLSALYFNTTRDGLSFAVVSSNTKCKHDHTLRNKNRSMPRRLEQCISSITVHSR